MHDNTNVSITLPFTSKSDVCLLEQIVQSPTVPQQLCLLQHAELLVYVTIYDFAVNLKEDIKAGKVQTINETIVGIQVKVINNENTQYVVGSGQGRASTIGQGFLKNPNMEWNQSSLSSASNKAMETAVVNVIKAIDRRGW